jgi:hypothetical protein
MIYNEMDHCEEFIEQIHGPPIHKLLNLLIAK